MALTRFEAFKEIIENYSTDIIVSLWNEYVTEGSGYQEDEIFTNDEYTLKTVFGDDDMLGFASRIYYGDYSPFHEYFIFNRKGNLESFIYVDEPNSPVDIDSLITDYVYSNSRGILRDDDIEEIVSEFINYASEETGDQERFKKLVEDGEIDYDTILDTEWGDILKMYTVQAV